MILRQTGRFGAYVSRIRSRFGSEAVLG